MVSVDVKHHVYHQLFDYSEAALIVILTMKYSDKDIDVVVYATVAPA